MVLRRAGEALLRSPPNLLTVLASASTRPLGLCHRAIAAHSRLSYDAYLPIRSSRTFSTTQAHYQTSGKSGDNEDSDFTSLLDTVLDRGKYGAQKSRSSDRNAGPNRSGANRSTFGSTFSPPPAKTTNYDDIFALPSQGGKIDGVSALPPSTPELPRVIPKLNSATGRTVFLDNARGRDLARSLQALNGVLARNQVRSDAFKQRFHERPGLKRKRLKSERWRRRFKEGFKYVTARVRKLKNQGW